MFDNRKAIDMLDHIIHLHGSFARVLTKEELDELLRIREYIGKGGDPLLTYEDFTELFDCEYELKDDKALGHVVCDFHMVPKIVTRMDMSLIEGKTKIKNAFDFWKNSGIDAENKRIILMEAFECFREKARELIHKRRERENKE